MTAHSYSWWLTPAVVVGLQIFQIEARIEQARWDGKALVFRFPLLFRIGITFIVPCLSYLLIRDWLSEDWFIRILGSAIVVCFLLAWPPSILITSQGVERRFWWKRRVFIPWGEVADAEINAGGDITLIGMNASIQFSRFQAGRDRFEREVRVRSRIKRFSTPEEVTSLHL